MDETMKRITAIILSVFLSSVMCVSLCSCGKSDESSGSSADVFNNAVDQMKQGDGTDNSGTGSDSTDAVKGGIRFTIIDSNTVKASINDPRILAYAMDMSEVKLKLFPDEETHGGGAFAFKIQFNEINGEIDCNVYPQTCKSEQIEGSNGSWVFDENIPGPDGSPLCGATVLEDTMLTFVVQYGGLGSIIENNPYYVTYIDYEEYTRGKIDGIIKQQQVELDLSGTSLAGEVDLSYFIDLYPEYFVIEEKFNSYKSYSGHQFVNNIDEYRNNAVDLLWTATSNSDISKKSVLIGSVDEFGIANYYMAVVYDSHKDLIRDYMCDKNINFTADFNIKDPDPDLITDDLLNRFIPENGGNIYGTWNYSIADNVLYWHFIPDFDEHYKSYDGFSIPHIEFCNAGINGSTDVLNIELDEIVHELIDSGNVEGDFEYTYQWDDMTLGYVNSLDDASSVKYKGYYHKAEYSDELNSQSFALSEEDEARMLEETLRIRNEIMQAEETERAEPENAPRTGDPSVECYMYDDDSTDFMLRNLDTDALEAGGAYEIDFKGYTIRLTAESLSDPHCEIGKYSEDTFEKITDTPCYRNLDGGPNCFTINANISAIDNVGWKQVEDMEFYELKDGKNRVKIDKPISINRWY